MIIPAHGPRFSDPFFSEFVAGVGNKAAELGFDLLLSTQAPTPDKGRYLTNQARAHTQVRPYRNKIPTPERAPTPGEILTYRRMVAGRRVDGLILSRTRLDDTRIEYLAETPMPFVVFGRTQVPVDYVYIDVDGHAGQAELTEHFIAFGHSRIAYITPPQYLTFSLFRIQGFHEAMARHGFTVPADYLLEGDLTESGGYAAAERMLTLDDPPTAIMTGNDLMALGVMNYAQSHGLRIGTDLAVGGFDDIPAAEHVHPGLTTVHQPIYQIGQQLTQTLLNMIAGSPSEQRGILMSPQLVVRGSSGKPRQR